MRIRMGDWVDCKSSVRDTIDPAAAYRLLKNSIPRIKPIMSSGIMP